jgi:hypothetical protein
MYCVNEWGIRQLKQVSERWVTAIKKRQLTTASPRHQPALRRNVGK